MTTVRDQIDKPGLAARNSLSCGVDESTLSSGQHTPLYAKSTKVIHIGCNGHWHSSPTETLQLAWAVVLGSYTGSEDVIFGTKRYLHGSIKGEPYESTAWTHLTLQWQDTVAMALHKISQDSKLDSQTEPEVLLAINSAVSIIDSATHQNKLCMISDHTYSLSVLCCLGETSISLQAVFDEETWEPGTVQMMLYQTRHAFNLIDNSTAVYVGDLRSVCPEGWIQLAKWNRQDLSKTQSTLVWPLIQKQCIEYPFAMAIDAWDGQLMYGELERRVSAVATRLFQAGLTPGCFIGLLLEKSMHATVIILGIIKAGAAFVLLDPTQPTRRLRSMREASNVTMLVASKRYHERGHDLANGPVLIAQELLVTPSLNLNSIENQPNNALYAGFTSGSTGSPKGFVMQHGAFASGLDAYSCGVGLNRHSRVFQFASYSFVVSITSQLAPLVNGACLCVPSQDQLDTNLAGSIRDLRANWVALTPSVARTLQPDAVPCLQTLVMVGEALTQFDIQKWHHISLYCLYGQSENAKGTMISRKTEGSDPSNIGYPYCGVGWIVDPEDHSRLAPVGVVGELLLQSPCLSQGYLNVDGSETFVENPPWLQSGPLQREGRCIKTGDLARRSPVDGSFQLVGRKGTRVKIRGQRVEFGEVEHQVGQFLHASQLVAADIICSADDVHGESPMLVVFILLEPKSNSANQGSSIICPPTAEFRRQTQLLSAKLKESLPGYMIPTSFVEVSRMPRTVTGKIDRRHLRGCASILTRAELLEYTVLRAAHQQPESQEEVILQGLCAQVLHMPRGQVGMNDTFIDLGGDSLMARQLITLARSEGLTLSLTDVLQQCTLASVTRRAIETSRSCESAPSQPQPDPFVAIRDGFLADLPPSLHKDDVEDVYPTLELQAAYASSKVVDCFPLHISGPLNTLRLHRACQTLVQRHAILRTVFHSFRGQLLQVVLRRLNVLFEVQECQSIDDMARWIESRGNEELKRPCVIDRPIIGFILVQTSQRQVNTLVMRLCHGQYDAICLRPLIQDLWTAYSFEPINSQIEFKTHVERCYRMRNPKTYAVWREILKGSQPPGPHLHPPLLENSDPAIAVYERKLPKVSPLPGTTRATMVKAAWFKALQQESGQQDLVFGQFVNAWTGEEGAMGPCMNVVPVRINSECSWTNKQLLQAIQSQHALTTSFDAIGWRDIVGNCTDWRLDTRPVSVVLHQNFEREIYVCVKDITCRKLKPMLSSRPVFPMLLVTYPNSNGLDALLLVSTDFAEKKDADRLLDYFARALQQLEQDPGGLLTAS